MKFRNILGIDFGGSGIKAAPVDAKTGQLLDSRHRIPTPPSGTPDEITEVMQQLVGHFRWKGPVGIGFPSVVKDGIIKTAANIHRNWVGTDASKMIYKKIKLPVCILNDADAAGLAEMKFGVGSKVKGVVLLITVGTGIGTVLFTKGKLVPNTELGHITLPSGVEAEIYASDAARERENLEWVSWAKRFNTYLQEMEKLLWPELIIIGGGVSKKWDLFKKEIHVDTKIVMASTFNEAGIIGAALACRINRDSLKKKFR